jgi:hydrogenase maturation protease
MHVRDAESLRKKLTIIGLGNEMLCDDGIGIKIARELRSRIADEAIAIEELSIGGLQLLDHIIGTERCIIVDALVTGTHPPGTMFRYVQSASDNPLTLTSSHQIDLGHILGLARFMGAALPNRVTVYGMEAEDITTFRETCTVKVTEAIPRLVDVIYADILSDGEARRSTTDTWQTINELVTD